MSIRVRLALVYAAVLAVALSLFGGLLYLAVQQYLAEQADRSLAELAQHVAAAIPASSQLDAQSLHLANIDPFAAPGLHIQILDAAGVPLVHSVGLGEKALPRSEGDVREALLGAATYYTASEGGERIRVYSRPLLHGGATVGVIQVGKSYHDYDLTLARLGQAEVAGGFLAILAAGLAGWAVAGGALRPIAEITETARAIASARDFERRLPQQKSADEVGRLAVAFDEMLDSLAAAYSLQRRFVADASHELRAPLTTVTGNLEFVRKAEDLPPAERREALDDALVEARRMGRLVGELLALARAEGGQKLAGAPVALAPLLDQVRQELATRAGEVGWQWQAVEDATVRGDADQLKQLALALLDNARKYTPAGGRVSVSLGREAGQAVLRVADSGIGIEPADLPHVFERFYRADMARGRGGSGLGLAIAKAIVGRHRGTIEVSSAPGLGTTFTVRLPLLVAGAAPRVVER